ncbi:MAG: hypothetical protein IJN48_04175 [Clostridia bacterium]|nr:hypothetical protein [Clostridia bacterium]
MKDTIKLNKKGVLMVAHRGLSGLEPENSCAAFVAAGNRSHYGIETDVHVTADGRYVIIHDDNTLRTTGVDMVVEESKYEDLKKLQLLGYDKEITRADLRIPDLVDYIRICKHYGKKAVLELKNPMSEGHLLGIIGEIRGVDYLSEVIFISFALENLLTLRKHLPDQPIQYLVKEIDDSVVDILTSNNFDVDVYYKALTAEQAKLLKEKGIKINVWTCNTEEYGDKMVELGVDFITTNTLE